MMAGGALCKPPHWKAPSAELHVHAMMQVHDAQCQRGGRAHCDACCVLHEACMSGGCLPGGAVLLLWHSHGCHAHAFLAALWSPPSWVFLD